MMFSRLVHGRRRVAVLTELRSRPGALALAATKPNEAAHHVAFTNRIPVSRALFRLEELLGHAELRYHDYFISQP
jgi:hypothetical protein